MNDDNDTGEDALARIDLHAWRVPPPMAEHRSSILLRALAPAMAPKRPRVVWMLAAIMVMNVIATIIVIILMRQPAPAPVTVLPAGGSALDAKTQELLRRLQDEQRELESKVTEIQELRALIAELSAKAQQCEESGKRERTLKRRDRPSPGPANLGTCDEVSCAITNHQAACCAKFRRPGTTTSASTSTATGALPEHLDRRMISAGIAAVKADITACGQQSTATGKVKVRVQVNPDGHVIGTSVEATPDPVLGSCVADVLKTTTFEATEKGGSFSYPFVF